MKTIAAYFLSPYIGLSFSRKKYKADNRNKNFGGCYYEQKYAYVCYPRWTW